MDNEHFINILQTCKDLGRIENEALDRLKTSELDIHGIYKQLEKGFNKNSTSLDGGVLLLRLLGRVDLAYRIRDDKEWFIDTFLKCMKEQSKIRIEKDYSSIRIWVYGSSYKSLELSKNLNGLRLVKLYPTEKVWLNGKEYKLSVGNGDGVNKITIDGKETGLGGLFIKDGQIEKIEVRCDRDFKKIMDKILFGKYDIGIIPSFTYYATRDIEYIYNVSRLDNKDYLEYLLLIGDMVEGSINTRTYWKIAQSDINYYKLISYLKEKTVRDGVILDFLSIIDDKIRREVMDDTKWKDKIKEVSSGKTKIVDKIYEFIRERRIDSVHLEAFKNNIMKQNMNGTDNMTLQDCMDLLDKFRKIM